MLMRLGSVTVFSVSVSDSNPGRGIGFVRMGPVGGVVIGEERVGISAKRRRVRRAGRMEWRDMGIAIVVGVVVVVMLVVLVL